MPRPQKVDFDTLDYLTFCKDHISQSISTTIVCFKNTKSDQKFWDLGVVRPPAKLTFGGLDYPILGMDLISFEACPGIVYFKKIKSNQNFMTLGVVRRILMPRP